MHHGRSASKTPLVTGLPTALLWSRLSTLCTFMASSCIFSSSSPFFAGDTAGGNACALPPSHVLLGLGCALSIERRLWPPCMVGSRASSQCLIKWCAGDRCSPDSLASPSRSPRPQVLFLLSVAFSCGASVGCYIRRLICGVRLRLVRRVAPRGCSLRSASLCPPSSTACCVVLLSGQPSAPCWRSRRRRRRPPSLGAALGAARAVRAVRVAWMRSRRASCAFKRANTLANTLVHKQILSI